MVKTEEMKIYLAESEEDCEAAYNAMLEQARSMGADELNAWADATYKEAKLTMAK